ncbi:excinuclease ABC subunit UvrA [Prevotella sp. P2-180]|uniref:excinuclease ABC subunit UvrA n=1 Tax=Prevotella sp. P2-180 TaxID=2024224 RepID=UPI000B9633C9|nr:excinuclease ABC subunit UvrA [Prevotella sp. P2-180]OYP64577.1 excinuclease ABC subunit A [Prevotella sp. P2-180]
MNKYIEIKGAKVNNLKNVSLNIPRNKFIVIAGVSGSGKSSLAFDTLYAEGQRRYVESLSAYARQFLGRMNKPECDYIKGIPPAIAIEQKVTSRNPRSTVGTSTEIYDYLRMLFARAGHTYSPISGNEVKKHSTEDIIQCVSQYSQGTKFVVMAPLICSAGRTAAEQLRAAMLQGYARIFVDSDFKRIDDYLETCGDNVANDIYIAVDRMSVDMSKDGVSRLVDSVETAFYEGKGVCRIMFMPSMLSYDFSTRFECDGMEFEEPNDNMFSFNSPAGACPECQGFGKVMGIDEHLVVPNPSLSVYDGCAVCWNGEKMKEWREEFCRRAAADNFPIFEPYYNLTREQKDWLWHGLPSEKHKTPRNRICIDTFFEMVRENQYKIQYRVMLSRYRGKTTCPRCHGTRLKPEADYVKIGGRSISDIVEMPIVKLKQWFDNLQLNDHDAQVAKRLLVEISNRLQFLLDVGLGYLPLNRLSNSLSGGESQRINLTTSLGSSLVGSLYILDEPSIGLHSRDTDKLIAVLKKLRDIGNTVIVVEHDEDIIRQADYLIDVGPDAGRLGGEIVYEGPLTPAATLSSPTPHPSYTLRYLSEELSIPLPTGRRRWNRRIVIEGARMNNLKGINVEIPLNVMTVVTGVSGSGKSSLIKGILYPALKRHIGEVCDTPGEYSKLSGDITAIKHVEFVDQNPIGKSSRSNPATYVKAYDAIRDLMAEQPLAKQMGFTPQFFSFNTDGGRCEECKGAGEITVEMQFMADIVLPCEACHGKRFKHDILEVRFHGKNISDILDMTISEAIEFFTTHGQSLIAKRLMPLYDVGLGYIRLGQSSSTLSGGENQRVKLAYFIGQEKQVPTMFIFDEPTTGLHFHDINRLLKSFAALIERGHTILIIEHNMDVIKCADHIIDMGPDGGDAGGNVVVCGTPEVVSGCKESITGHYLKDKLY